MKNKLKGVKSRIFNSLNEEQKKIFEEKQNKYYMKWQQKMSVIIQQEQLV